MANSAFVRTMVDDDIVLLTFDLAGKSANILSQSVLDELDEHLTDLEKQSEVAGLIIQSAKPDIFIAGADLREFVVSLDAPAADTVKVCQRGQVLFGRLAKTPFPTVAAINGICVGGGAELAIWCDRRIVSNNSKTQFGFPEVKLGLFPGWGGTVRAPRIVGLANAVEMITSGESISAPEAFKCGLASNCVPAERLTAAAISQIRLDQDSGQYLRDRERWSQPIPMNHTELGFLGATASAVITQKTKGHYPAPAAALELMLETSMADAESALEREAMGMSELFGSPVNRSLINVFFLNDRVKRDAGVADKSLKPRKLTQVGVVGAGIMGTGIAAANLKRGCTVALNDVSSKAMAAGAETVLEEVAYNKVTKGKDTAKLLSYAPLLNTVPEPQDLAHCELVIEAIVENCDVKQKLYKSLEPALPVDAILASNTSTIPITKLATVLEHRDRFCGIHFFNPVRSMQLVEVIRGEETSDATVATAVAHVKRIGKLPIVVNDGPGFLVNRILLPYMNEAVHLLCEGADMGAIERASRTFGMPMGPFTLYDVVGIDTAHYAGQTMVEAFPDRVVRPALLESMVAAGRLGQKSGSGFFAYQGPRKKKQPDPALAEILAPHVVDRDPPAAEEITNRLFLTMLLEATRILDEGIVRDVRDVDFGLIFGIGFPPFKGGLMFWADTVGAKKIVERLKPLSELGERVKPTPMLLELARQNGKFYEM